jgi:hypothetical protein
MLFSLLSVGYAEDLTLSTDTAVAIHISEYGLAKVSDAIQKIIPSEITISAGSGYFECGDNTTLNYELADTTIYLGLDDVSFTTQDNQLFLDIYGTMGSNQSTMYTQGECSIFSDIDEECLIQIPTTAFDLSIDITLDFQEGQLTVMSGEPIFNLTPIPSPIEDCLLADAVGTVLGQNERFISDLIIQEIEPTIQDFPVDIENALGDALEGLSFSTQTELLAAELNIELFPTKIQTENDGLTIGLGATTSVNQSANCVDTSNYPPPTDVQWPTFNGIAIDSDLQYDAGVFLGRHFVDQILYLAWSSGALCLDVADLTGLTLTGEAVGGFFGEETAELLGSTPVQMFLAPNTPPQTIFDDDQPPIIVMLNDFELNLHGIIEERTTRILSIDVDAQIDIFADLLENKITLDLPLTEDSFWISEDYSDFLAAGYSEGVPSLFQLALNSFAPELPSIPIPTILGVEMSNLIWLPSNNQDWQGGYVFLNTDNVETIPIAGCNADILGCGSEGPTIDLDIETLIGCDEVSQGCDDSSCNQGGPIKIPAGRIFALLLVCIGFVIRRK